MEAVMTASSERENKIPEPPSGTLATPPWLRELASPDREQASLGRPPRVSRIEEGGKLNWPPPRAKLACFESNLNIRELRCELSVDPNCVPASQMHARRRPAMSPV